MVEVEDGNTAGWLLQVARAQQDSSVLEHVSRLLLLCEDAVAGVAPPPDLWDMSFSFLSAYHSVTVMCHDDDDALTDSAAAEAEAVRATLLEVLRGPCARHAALVHGVAMLCRVDGGPSYGLPARLLSAALPRTCTDSAVPGGLVICDNSPGALLAVCQEGMPPTRLGRRIAVLLLLRLGRLAVASAAARAQGACDARATWQLPLPPSLQPQQQHRRTGEGDAEAGASGALGQLLPPKPPLLLLSTEHVDVVALAAIGTAWSQLQEALALQPDGWAAEAEAELWRLVDAAMREGMGANNEQLRWLGWRLSCGLDAVLAKDEPLPPAPPPLFAVALAGGVLPCVERILRRAGEAPFGPEASFAEGRSGPFLVALLAYGEPRQAAALVATLGKLLRGFSSLCPAPAVVPTGMPDLVVKCVRGVLLPVLYDDENVLSSRWVGTGQQHQQLAHMTSYAVCEWLPPLSRPARQWIAADVALGLGGTWRSQGLGPLVCWLPLLACRALIGGSGAFGAVDEAAAGATGATVAAAGAWRRFILEEVAAVPLLTEALCLCERDDAACSNAFNHLLALGCCGVAAACPEEVLGAGREGAAGAAHAPCADALPCSAQGRSEPARGPAQWRPELLRVLARILRAGGEGICLEALEALSAHLGAWEAGSGNPSEAWREKGEKCRKRLLAACALIPCSAPLAMTEEVPRAVRAALRRLPAIAGRTGDGDGALLVDPADVDELCGLLGTIRDYLATRDGAAEAQIAVLGKSAARLALLRLIAAAKLLCMDTLQCLSKQFAAAATAAGVLTPPQLEYVARAATFFCDLAAFSFGGMMVQVEYGDMAGWLLQVARALRDSSVLEHVSRLLLLCEDAVAGVAPPPDQWDLPSICLGAYNNAAVPCRYGAATGAASDAEAAEVLRGPCAQHAALVHGVAMLCRADGGPSYGLPARLLSAALPRTRADSAVPGALVVCDHSPRALLAVCQEAMPPTRLGRCIAVLLLLRLGRLVQQHRRSDEGDAEAGASGALGPLLPPKPPLLLLSRQDVDKVALTSISTAWRQLQEALALQPDGWASEAGAQLWRLVDAAMREGMGADNVQLRQLGSNLSCEFEAVLAKGEPLPPVLPPMLAVVLAGGVLPCVERMLRRAGEAPLGPEASFAEGFLHQAISGPFLVALLAYGEPRQAAALVATLGKLLHGFSSSCPAVAVVPTGVMDLVMTCVRCVLLAVLVDDKGVLSSRWVGAGQGHQQLVRMTSYAVCEWLPPLSRLARQWMAARAAPSSDDTWRRLGLGPLVCWLPLLACRALIGSSGSVGAADDAAAGSPEAAATAAGGWRRFVLEEVAAVPLLGDALRMRERKNAACSDGANNLLALSCCAMAAACPEEVLGAGREGAAGAAHAPCADVLTCNVQGRTERTRGGDVAAAAPASSPPAAPASPPCPSPAQWRPELLRALAQSLLAGGYGNEAGEALEALATQLEVCEAGGGDPCKARGEEGEESRERALAAWGQLQAARPNMTAIAAVLLPPAEARALLRTCSYPACANLAGDSEADLRLQSCGKCAAAAYCCRACQVAHWRAGHREACALLGPGAVES
ncbi:hypothetical protein TSOC_003274 [Tetrabaena socialis]|uniref:phytol kinase n=1 Tax=Tetrabaena socialis TaxID=47790 RepID=A0A2J8AC05_9CHLO|nr:hypothetical protein TSOC_003274 [Tetrabaena socialis]|eukprot:PNH10027.1 hypothetical protein TSOC_003274 [Tetrabaena socialis]